MDEPGGQDESRAPNASGQADREPPSFVERLKAAPVSFAIMALNVAVFVVSETGGRSSRSTSTLIELGAVDPAFVWAGEYWRLASYMFLHAGVMHLAMNMFGFFPLAAALERGLGKGRFLLLYLASGIGGGAACVIFQPALTVGASGAIFGLVGATFAIRRHNLGSWRAFFTDPQTRGRLVNIAIWMAVITFAMQGTVSHGAHAGGLLVGGAVTLLFAQGNPRSGWLAFGVVFAALLANAAHPWAPPKGKQATRVAVYAQAYLTGEEGWPIDRGRGLRLAERGCSAGIATACQVLSEDFGRQDGPAAKARAEELLRRACELDPSGCEQIH